MALKLYLYVALVCLTVSGIPSLSAADTSTLTNSAGDITLGKRIFNRCKACHNLTQAKRTRLGPNLNNLFSRTAGTASGYKYSRALREAGFSWTEAKLDEWLTKPSAFLPGNKMQFAGLRKAKDRKDLIAYLRQATIQED